MFGRVVIDFYVYYYSENKFVFEFVLLENEEEVVKELFVEEELLGFKDEMVVIIVNFQILDWVDDFSFLELFDEYFLLIIFWFIGFDIKVKDWGCYCIENLWDIDWNDSVFDNLVFKGGEKQFVWEFVVSKKVSIQECDDFVVDKGMYLFFEGII